MIVDGFTFFNELDILEVRLHTLAPVVDRFVLVESPLTFAGQSKPLYFEENKSLFKEFPITHIVVEDMPITENRWEREIFQRNAISRGFAGLSSNDWVLISDVDEIPFPESIVATPRIWSMKTYYYTVNQIIDVYQEGPVLNQYSKFTTAQEQRNQRYQLPATHNQCWHFSFFGGENKIMDKIHAFSHAEYDTPYYNNSEHLQKVILNNQDLFERSYPIRKIVTEDTLPTYLLSHRDRFPGWFTNGD